MIDMNFDQKDFPSGIISEVVSSENIKNTDGPKRK